MHEPSSDEKTHFGFEEVPIQDKVKRVAEVFHSVADNYDLMNDLMSLGIHRLWKKQALELAQVKKGHRVLDLAGGTGDMTKGLMKKVGPHGQVILADINASMLSCGRTRLYDEGFIQPLSFVQADGESLPFKPNYFDRATIAFGLRNITRKEQALASLFSVLKPGGQLVILEFSQPLSEPLKRVYDLYSFKILPKLGEWVAKDADSYRYLAESIRMHPNQTTAKSMVLAAGFDDCEVRNLTGGIVAVHICRKF